MFTSERLNRALAALGMEPSADIFAQLRAAYTEPGRHYHTDIHIAECLAHFEEMRATAHHRAEIEIALWFHDAIYDTRRDDSEERSAEWAASFLTSNNVDEACIARITGLIMATKTHEARDMDAEIMLDIDLGILGAGEDAFEAYDAAIRLEYHWVPTAQYRAGRARVLSGFLERTAIYKTQEFHSRYEQQARANLARKIKELRLT